MMKKNNILFIMTDQWRAECFGLKKHKFVQTPNIDAISRGGDWFDNAFTTTPLCSPARGSLLTGKLTYDNGVLDNMNIGASTQEALSVNCDTWLDAGVRQGYNTAYIGKWHLGEANVDCDNIKFDTVYQEWGKNNYGAHANEKGGLNEKYQNVTSGDSVANKPPFYAKTDEKDKSMIEQEITNRAIDFLESTKDTPWFLTVSYNTPHFPHTIPEPYASMFSPDDMVLPVSLSDRFIMKPWFQNRHWWESMATEDLTEEDWRKTTAAYYGYIKFIDDEIGRLMKAVRSASGDTSTIVVFTSDHGEMLGAHSRFDKGPYFYDEVMRIPLMINMKYGVEADECQVHKEYCNIVDVGQTLFDLVGEKAQGYGKSLLPTIKGSDKRVWPDEAFGLYHKYNGHSFEIRTIRTADYKYSFVPQDIDELYDLKNDKNEMINIIDRHQYKDVVKRLKARLFEWMRENNDPLLDQLDNLPKAGSIIM